MYNLDSVVQWAETLSKGTFVFLASVGLHTTFFNANILKTEEISFKSKDKMKILL